MQDPVTDIEEMIKELNRFQLPGSLMECFDSWREEAAGAVFRQFSQSQLTWYLDLLNRFRGPEDRKDCLIDVFDPGMYTANHPAWEAPPGTMIELPPLTSQVAAMAFENSEFTEIARAEIRDFRDLARSFTDEEIFGLARIASAALADQNKCFEAREDGIVYLALNASARLEDLWAKDDTLWVKVPSRRIHFDDMTARRKAELLAARSARPPFQEKDFACYTEDEIRAFAFDASKLFLMERARHLAICSRCRRHLEYWSGLVENFDRAARLQEGKSEHESEG